MRYLLFSLLLALTVVLTVDVSDAKDRSVENEELPAEDTDCREYDLRLVGADQGDMTEEQKELALKESQEALVDCTKIPDPKDHPNVVLAVQKKLDCLGYNPKGLDGGWGPNTIGALNRYREREGLRQHKDLDWGTLEHLFGPDYIKWKLDDLEADLESSAPQAER